VCPKKGRENIELFVKLDNSMTDSAAWTALSDKAIWVYIELKKSFDTRKGGNNHLVLPYSKVSWRMNLHTFSIKIKELIHYGFIDIRERGGLYRRPNVYALSERWKTKSLEIVDKEGREAIKLGFAKKPSFKNNIKNLKGKRTWERKKI